MKNFVFLLLLSFVFISANAQDDPLKEYVGVYKFPDGSVIPSVEVKLENGVLVGYSQMGSAVLDKIAKDTFSITTYNGMAYFGRNSDNAVTGVRIEVQDLILEGKKEISGVAILNRRVSNLIRVIYVTSYFTSMTLMTLMTHMTFMTHFTPGFPTFATISSQDFDLL